MDVWLSGAGEGGDGHTDWVVNIDNAPTILDLAGVGVSADMQGRSVAPLLKGSVPRIGRGRRITMTTNSRRRTGFFPITGFAQSGTS